MTLPEAVKRLRQHLNLKQIEFAQHLGISLPSAWRYENEARSLPVAVLLKLHSLAVEHGEEDLAELFACSGDPIDPRFKFAEMALPHIDEDLALALMDLMKSVFDPTLEPAQRKDLVGEAVLKLMKCREFIQTTNAQIAEV